MKIEICPTCGRRLHRSRRKGLVALIRSKITGKYTYSCRKCGFEVIQPRSAAPKDRNSLRNALLFLLFLMLSLALTFYSLRRFADAGETATPVRIVD